MKLFIENEYLKVGINTFGGSLTSIYDKKTSEEMLYQPIPNSWQGQDVVIFPFVGRLKDKTYTVDGKTYSMENHGLLRYDELKVSEHLNDYIELTYESNDETYRKYPFRFVVRVQYKLVDNNIEVKYIVDNIDDKTIYYGIGGHPAFICDGVLKEDEFDITGNKVVVYCGDANKVVQNSSGTFMKGIEPVNVKEFNLSKDLFRKEKTIIINSDSLYKIALYRKNGKSIEIKMFDNKYVAIWSDENFGNYCALEPWWSLPDFEDCDKELSKKLTILSHSASETKEYKYIVTVK